MLDPIDMVVQNCEHSFTQENVFTGNRKQMFNTDECNIILHAL